MDLQVCAHISAAGEWGADEDVLGTLRRALDVLKANQATSSEVSCPEEV
jgi:hypothetical protein